MSESLLARIIANELLADNVTAVQGDVVMTLDTKAINYILTHSHDFPKPEMTRFALSNIVGPGMFTIVSITPRA